MPNYQKKLDQQLENLAALKNDFIADIQAEFTVAAEKHKDDLGNYERFTPNCAVFKIALEGDIVLLTETAEVVDKVQLNTWLKTNKRHPLTNKPYDPDLTIEIESDQAKLILLSDLLRADIIKITDAYKDLRKIIHSKIKKNSSFSTFRECCAYS